MTCCFELVMMLIFSIWLYVQVCVCVCVQAWSLSAGYSPAVMTDGEEGKSQSCSVTLPGAKLLPTRSPPRLFPNPLSRTSDFKLSLAAVLWPVVQSARLTSKSSFCISSLRLKERLDRKVIPIKKQQTKLLSLTCVMCKIQWCVSATLCLSGINYNFPSWLQSSCTFLFPQYCEVTLMSRTVIVIHKNTSEHLSL